jgi:valyl-tRNA synthetase
VQSAAGVPPAGNNVKTESAGKMPATQIEGTDVPVNSLAGLALKPLLDGRLRFIPERYAKTYQAWLENLRDWPISRQLWWGHRIPVWHFVLSSVVQESEAIQKLTDLLTNCGVVGKVWPYRKEGTSNIYICLENGQDDSALDALATYSYQIANSAQAYTPGDILESGQPTPTRIRNNKKEALNFLKTCANGIISRDEDVLDTWFSSALWPFSTLGWPEESPLLNTFYPGDVLCTAREIITLWVSRMVMMGQYCVGNIPFKDVYIHAMIQDGEGRKMSKSLGNGIDPLVAINSHGADAMRFTLASMTTDTQDIRMPVVQMTLPDGRVENTSPKFDIGRNFCNKLWNASRFAMMNLEGVNPDDFDKAKMTIADKWILSRLARTIAEVTTAIDSFKYNEPLNALYKFFWNDFCDWYLEWAKPRMQDAGRRPIAQNALAFVLDQVLRLLHPFVPFITEGIFQKLNEIAPLRGLKGIVELKSAKALVIAGWPQRIESLIDDEAERRIEDIQTVIRAIRDIRSKYNRSPGEKLIASVNAPDSISNVLNANSGLICQLAGLREFSASPAAKKPQTAAAAIAEQMQIYLHEAIDVMAEKKRLAKQKEQVEQTKKSIEAKLANENFINRAKPEVVAQTKEKLVEYTEQLKAIEKHLAELEG